METINFSDTQPAFMTTSNVSLQFKKITFLLMNHPALAKNLKRITDFKLLMPLIKKTVFPIFVGGETITQAMTTVEKRLVPVQIGAVLDYSVEVADTEEKIQFTIDTVKGAIRQSAHYRKFLPFAVFKISGLMQKQQLVLLSSYVKNLTVTGGKEIQALYHQIVAKVNSICQEAFRYKVKVMIDAEGSDIQDLIDLLTLEMMKLYNHERCTVINTYQCYLKDGLDKLKRQFTTLRSQGIYFGAKVVRGAYMETERIKAGLEGKPSPICESKDETDVQFNSAINFCFKNISEMEMVVATHNETSIQETISLMERHKIEAGDSRIYFAQLFGMSDNLSCNLAKHGFNVCKYLPFGPVHEVLPYLIRRINENSSIRGQSGRELILIKNEIARRRKL